jgi:hypothetical protein
MFAFVGSFFLSMCFPAMRYPLFLTGATVGGMGAGVLWPSQSSYFETSASRYSEARGTDDKSGSVVTFAAIFVAFYLSFETGFKLIATAVFLAAGPAGDWRGIVFGFYAAAALMAIVLFYFLVIQFSTSSGSGTGEGSVRDSRLAAEAAVAAAAAYRASLSASGGNNLNSINCSNNDSESTQSVSSLEFASNKHGGQGGGGTGTVAGCCQWVRTRYSSLVGDGFFAEATAVMRAVFSTRIIQYMIPYQICFGLSSGFVNTYVSGIIVTEYLSDGYIGLLSGLATLSAVAVVRPCVYVSKNVESGKWYIMVFGGLCFAWAGIPLLLFSDKFIASWAFIVPYFCVHGAARSIWENTNKAVVAEYFAQDETERTVAFASIYVFSGISGAFGYLMFKFMSRLELSLLNAFVAIAAIVFYHLSFKLHERDKAAWAAMSHSLRGSASTHSAAHVQQPHSLLPGTPTKDDKDNKDNNNGTGTTGSSSPNSPLHSSGGSSHNSSSPQPQNGAPEDDNNNSVTNTLHYDRDSNNC